MHILKSDEKIPLHQQTGRAQKQAHLRNEFLLPGTGDGNRESPVRALLGANPRDINFILILSNC